jgi:hypothetical protein
MRGLDEGGEPPREGLHWHGWEEITTRRPLEKELLLLSERGHLWKRRAGAQC